MSDHEHQLLSLLTQHTSLGPKQAATALGWTKEQVAQAKESMASKGLIRLGKGGSMQVAKGQEAGVPLAGNLLAPETTMPVTKQRREVERLLAHKPPSPTAKTSP
ncbi:MAG: hypothetical protein JNL52_08965 [Flavobacteriales bacterium]|nr:hypothetical protein [Flavobacteriales bacterium]